MVSNKEQHTKRLHAAISARLKQLSNPQFASCHRETGIHVSYIFQAANPFSLRNIFYYSTHKPNKNTFSFSNVPCMADPRKRGRTAVIAWKKEKVQNKPQLAAWHLASSFFLGWISCLIRLLQGYGEQT